MRKKLRQIRASGFNTASDVMHEDAGQPNSTLESAPPRKASHSKFILEHIALLFVRAERRAIYTLLADAGKVMCHTYSESVPQTDTGIQVE